MNELIYFDIFLAINYTVLNSQVTIDYYPHSLKWQHVHTDET
jgi:hypothetical protein